MRAHEFLGESMAYAPEFQAELQTIADFADSVGVEIDVQCEHGTLNLLDIARETGQKGAGSQVMQKLVDFCDKYDLEMSLDCKRGIPRLREYYESFGFEMEQWAMDQMIELGDEFDGPWVMYRLPR